jgi:hypothetical protein
MLRSLSGSSNENLLQEKHEPESDQEVSLMLLSLLEYKIIHK